MRYIGRLSVTVSSTTATTISLSWSVPSGLVVDSYEVIWERDTSGECPDEDEGSAAITDGSTSYTITGLEEDSNYTITVNATNAAGSAASDPVTGMTGEAGEGLIDMVYMNRQPDQIISSPPVPSATPTSVNTSDVTSSSITVQWGAVGCIHHNGDITGYSVQYGVQGSAEGDRTVVMVSGDSSGGMYEISGLTPSTTYTIEVAAVNSAGTGVYSDPTSVLTSGAVGR